MRSVSSPCFGHEPATRPASPSRQEALVGSVVIDEEEVGDVDRIGAGAEPTAVEHDSTAAVRRQRRKNVSERIRRQTAGSREGPVLQVVERINLPAQDRRHGGGVVTGAGKEDGRDDRRARRPAVRRERWGRRGQTAR